MNARALDGATSRTSTTAHPRPAVGLWLLVLIGVFVLEFFLFDQFGARRHTGVYPKWNDQVQYLGDGYTAWDHARTHGFVSALGHTLTNPSAQGTLHDTAALIVFQLAGPSRSAALALNGLALIAWQFALFVGVARVSRRPDLAFASALLPLALAGPWENIPGSAYDFRLDHLAMCALGVASATALLTDGFRSRGGAVFFGVAVALTLLLRFLTGTYFVLIFAGLLAWIVSIGDRRARITNLAWAALVAFVLAAPFFWINRSHLYEYYWIGHYLGPESAIRNQNFGPGRSLVFIVQALTERHLGAFFGIAALLGAAGLGMGRGHREATAARTTAFIGALWLFAPATVLLLHQQKSEVVVGALGPGVVLLVIALWLRLTRAPADKGPPRATYAISSVVSSLILAFFAQRQLRPAYDAATLAHIRQVNTIADTLFARIQAAGLDRPAIGVDYITDCLDAQVLRVICFERKGVWLALDMTLPISIAEPDTREVRARLGRSHFVFLTEEAPEGTYPFDRKLAALRPELRAWCEANLVLTQRFDLLGRRMALYQRPEIALLPKQ